MVVGELEKVAKRGCPVLTVHAMATVLNAADRMRTARVGCLLVKDEAGIIVGIVAERDIVHRIVAEGRDAITTTIAEIMIHKIFAVKLTTPISRARDLMSKHNIRHLPVVENGVPVAMISARDILAHEISMVRSVARGNPSLLRELEQLSPGITEVQMDESGRIVM